MRLLPTIVVHGFTGGRQTFQHLALPNFLSPVLSGHGSQPDMTVASFEAEMARLDALLPNEPHHYVGYSMGARVLLGLALHAPHKMRTLCLVGVNPGLATIEARESRATWEGRWVSVLQSEGLDAFVDKWSSQPLFASHSNLTSDRQQLQESERKSHTAQGLAHALKVLGLAQMPNYWPRIAALKVPTLCLYGQDDSKFQDISERIATVCPFAQASGVAGAGHNPLIEAPAACRSAIETFQESHRK